jgi:hypothetical protein
LSSAYNGPLSSASDWPLLPAADPVTQQIIGQLLMLDNVIDNL